MAALLQVDNLRVSIGLPTGTLHAVRGSTLTLARGESLGIVGESGSGKSMTALALMRLLPRVATVAADRMVFDGEDLATMPERDFATRISGSGIGMIFQDPMTSLNPVYPIERQLTEAAIRFGGMTPAAARARALQLLERVEIPDPALRLRQYPHQLSGGQCQRVMIAMALMREPSLLIADEPTTALDVTVQAQILGLLADLRRELGMALILISHDLAVVSQNTDRVAVMSDGAIVEQNRTPLVLSQPVHPYTQTLLAAVPRIDDDALRARAAAQVQTPAEAAAGPALEARDIRQIYRTRQGLFGPRRELRALDGVSLTVPRGRTLALVGESGSGKSTLARILLGLAEPTSGEALLMGRPVASYPATERAGIVQPIFQNPYAALNARRTVYEIIARPLELRGTGDAAGRLATVRRMMDLVRLPARLLHSYPSQLSGGQRQRVAIARAIVCKPAVLVCDEPTSALDVSVQAQILQLLIDLRSELGLTCLLITHDMAVVHRLADEVAVLLQGRLVEHGPAVRVLTDPQSDYTRTLLAAAPRIVTAPEAGQLPPFGQPPS